MEQCAVSHLLYCQVLRPTAKIFDNCGDTLARNMLGRFRMDISSDELKAIQDAADITEIQMLFGRYATLLDQFDGMGIYNELMAHDNPDVSVEYTCNGRYDGPGHVKVFFEDFNDKLTTLDDKRGWLDFTDGVTPHIVISDDGKYAWASWTMFGPKAKHATACDTLDHCLTAFWYGGKMYWELIKVDGKWKILHFHQATYLSAPYHLGWVKQPECWREAPVMHLLPDHDQRFYAYNPNRVYVKNSPELWGPYVPAK